MAKHLVVFEPSGLRISVNEPCTILEAARAIGLAITVECGGKGTCGKCRVVVEPAGKPNNHELDHIPLADLEQGVRMACEYKVSETMRVILPQLHQETKILTKGITRQWDIDPNLNGQYGIAIDLGTTTIVAFLLDLTSGTQLAQVASLNPQTAFGEDVMSRLTYAIHEERGLEILQNRVVSEINRLSSQLIESGGIDSIKITRVSITGNTAMNHLLLGVDVKSLGLAPYTPSFRHSITKRASELGLHTGEISEIYIAPNIAGFVGGDTVAFILSQQLDSINDVTLGVDIGTNGEIVLSNNGELFCCSAAAGSAFEGATIHQGMRGQIGAIEHVIIHNRNKQPEIFVIGNAAPRGLCGSAIVDIVAEMKRVNIIDKSGRMLLDSPRVRDEENIGRSYHILESGDSSFEYQIVFTQRDVRQVQLAKAAIQAGTKLLLEEVGLVASDIDRVLLAGAFGNYIRPKSALDIGLLPKVDISKIIPIGNAAGEGAKGLLLSSKTRLRGEKLIDHIKYIELASHKHFQDVFLDSIALQ
jgi:uncharacterized 2Fe-2S/4Fe-4S cluster protein (DUF4445 family)